MCIAQKLCQDESTKLRATVKKQAGQQQKCTHTTRKNLYVHIKNA